MSYRSPRRSRFLSELCFLPADVDKKSAWLLGYIAKAELGADYSFGNISTFLPLNLKWTNGPPGGPGAILGIHWDTESVISLEDLPICFRHREIYVPRRGTRFAEY
jgi:hypothetical protein